MRLALALLVALGCASMAPAPPLTDAGHQAAQALQSPDSGAAIAPPDALLMASEPTPPDVELPDARLVLAPADSQPQDATGSLAACPVNQAGSLCRPFYSNPSCNSTPSPVPCRTLTWDCSVGPCGLVAIVVSDCQLCLLANGVP